MFFYDTADGVVIRAANGGAELRLHIVIKRAIARHEHLQIDLGFRHIGDTNFRLVAGRAGLGLNGFGIVRA